MVDSDPLSPSPPLPTDASMTSPLSINLASNMDGPAKKTPAPLRKRVFSKEEVATHNSEESCWLIVGNDVYDVTAFLALHPAGAKPLLRRAGGDATRDFSFHSRTAQNSWRQYKIGVLEGSESFCLLM
jgi:cytochrome b involved in lipid metabolism